MIQGFKKTPHHGKDLSQNRLSLNEDGRGLQFQIELVNTLDPFVAHRRESGELSVDRYEGYIPLKELERDTSSNQPIHQPHAIIGVGFRWQDKVRVYDFFRHSCAMRSTTGHVIASMLGIQQGFYLVRPWRDSPISEWSVFLSAREIWINGKEVGDSYIKTIEANGLNDVYHLLPSIRLSVDGEDVAVQLIDVGGEEARKEGVEIFLETTTGLLREARVYTNSDGKAFTKLMSYGKGKVKAGFKFFPGKTEIQIG